MATEKTHVVTKIYPEPMFKVEYSLKYTGVDFIVWEIDAINEENPEDYEIQNETPEMKGSIRWHGCCDFNYEAHYCGIHGAENFLTLMKEIYRFTDEAKKYVEENNDVFEPKN